MSLAFTAGGIAMILGGEPTGWFCALFFGLCAAVFGVQLLPSASWLRLTKEGFSYRTLFRQGPFVPWTGVSEFCAAQVHLNRMVVYDNLRPGANAGWGGRLRRANQALVGAGEALPDTYGMKAQELADLMNTWRGRALQL